MGKDKIKQIVKKYIKEQQLKEIEHFIIEGIDVDSKNKTVKVNLNHEEGINTSINNNPTVTKMSNGINVYSIFKRKSIPNINLDGNPLVHALKNNKGWIVSDYDKRLLLNQFNQIVNKIPQRFDTLIKLPSSNDLNNLFMNLLKKKLHFDNLISDEIFPKLSKEDVFENSVNGKEIPQKAFNEIVNSFNKMKNNKFSFKEIQPENRKYISNIFDGYCDVVNFGDKINDKNILILDDVMATGASISNYVENINAMFAPKSINVITLFSKL